MTFSASELSQKLVFIVGKGGVGRSSVAAALGYHFATRGEKTLIVQWTLSDTISPAFGRHPSGHASVDLLNDLSVMNFSPDEAIREYFVEHLGMKLLYKVVIENRHVQRLIHAAPGVQELFFLGRLFWLMQLAREERGWEYSRIIVDAPATGHGVSLFSIAQTFAGFGITGPLASECERVAAMLADAKSVGTIVVTLPEELPVEETLEFVPKIEKEMRRPPLAVLVNRSASRVFSLDARAAIESHWYESFARSLGSESARQGAQTLVEDLAKRNQFETMFQGRLKERIDIPVQPVSDILLVDPQAGPRDVILGIATELSYSERNPLTLGDEP